jgi:hypothetical protein
MPKYRRKTASVSAFKVTGAVNLDNAPRWLLILMAEGKVRKPQGLETGRLVALDQAVFDNEWLVKDRNEISVIPDETFIADFEGTGEPED